MQDEQKPVMEGEEDGPFGQPGICSECHEDSYEVDEATELCLSCYEHIFGLHSPHLRQGDQ